MPVPRIRTDPRYDSDSGARDSAESRSHPSHPWMQWHGTSGILDRDKRVSLCVSD